MRCYRKAHEVHAFWYAGDNLPELYEWLIKIGGISAVVREDRTVYFPHDGVTARVNTFVIVEGKGVSICDEALFWRDYYVVATAVEPVPRDEGPPHSGAECTNSQ